MIFGRELLLQAYQAKKTFKVNYLLFTALKELRDHQMASLLAEDYLLDYLRDDQKPMILVYLHDHWQNNGMTLCLLIKKMIELFTHILFTG